MCDLPQHPMKWISASPGRASIPGWETLLKAMATPKSNPCSISVLALPNFWVCCMMLQHPVKPIVMNLPYHRISFLGAKIVDRGLCSHISTLISLHTKSFIYLFFELRIHVSKFSQSKTAPSPMWMSLYCCNLSGCAALNVWFTMNGIFVKKNTIYMWREQAKMDWSRRVISIVFCCHSANLCAHAARDFRSQQYIWALSQTISLIYHPTSSVVYALLHLLSDDSHDEYFWTETWASRTRWLFPKLSVCQRYFMVARPRSYMAVTSRLLNNSTFPAFKECLDYTGGTKFPM